VLEHNRWRLELFPPNLRARILWTLKDFDEAFDRRGDLSPDEIDQAGWDLDCAVPLPLEEILSAGHPTDWTGLIEVCDVLVAEVLELRARVATLEEARS
jgi:hypothetical protein